MESIHLASQVIDALVVPWMKYLRDLYRSKVDRAFELDREFEMYSELIKLCRATSISSISEQRHYFADID